ncbi:DUF72 domain-containing protein [Kallotenue papyrolyticum]|uniref:DUF72 domain-containing protein n=1 Tax=Kallotenue papyrolyticum TaxID=1325125 RepID=UPI0004785C6F|nr:DUF72 domain-containing protein [Kallotenue papyrolyticum]
MLRIGTSGYSYADWKGCFYPPDIKPGEMLAFYAREFDTVEINYTYYRPPSARTLAAMAANVPPGFLFTIKATREMTHEREDNAAAFRDFVAALAPLIADGKFGCVLAQFPSSFRQGEAERRYLATFRERLGDLPLVYEFRHRSWLDEAVLAFLRALDVGFCCVDEPRFASLMPPVAVATNRIGYVRFHGRNAAKWWQHEHAWERYAYRYSEDELREWVPRVQTLRQQCDVVYLFANNHYQAGAIDTARKLRALLGEMPTGAAH